MPPDIDVKMIGQELIPEYCLYRFEGTMFYPPLQSEFLEENVGVKNIPVHIVVFENDLFGNEWFYNQHDDDRQHKS